MQIVNKRHFTVCLLIIFSMIAVMLAGCNKKAIKTIDEKADQIEQAEANYNTLLEKRTVAFGNNMEASYKTEISYGPAEESLPLITTQIDIKAEGAKGNGTTDDSSVILSAIEKFSGNGYIFFKKGNYLIANDITVPANVVLVLAEGASFTVAGGKTMTILGYVDATVSQIFKGDGTVAGKIKGAGYPQWFGAKGDLVANDAAAFQKAVNALSYVKVPAASKYIIGADLTLSSPVTIEGIGANQVYIYITGDVTNLFKIQSGSIEIKNFYCVGNTLAASTVFYFNTAAGNIQNVTMMNVSALSFGSLIKDAKNGTNKVTNVYTNAVRIDVSQAAGVDLYDFDSNIEMNDILVNNLGSGTYVGGARFIVQNCKGLKLWNADVAGNYSDIGAAYAGSGDAYYFKNCQNISINRLMADAVGGYCLKIENSTNLLIESSVVSLFDKGGFYFNNVTNSTFKNCKINNDGSSTYSSPDSGIVLTGGSNGNTFDNLLIQGVRSDGLSINHSADNKLKGAVISDCNGRAYVEAGATSNNNKFYGLSCYNNSSATNIVQVGAGSAIYGLNDKSGSFTATVAGTQTK